MITRFYAPAKHGFIIDHIARVPRLRAFWALLLIVLVALGLSPAFAQTDAGSVARKAIAFLQSKLPPPFPGVDSYTFSPQTFADAGLGCPPPGQTFQPAPTPGYAFLFTVKGVLYQVNTNLDGSSAVLCDLASVKVDTPLVPFRSAQFSVQYPEKWLITPRDGNEFYLGPTPQQVCTQPGMILNLLGKLQSGKTADLLLSDYLANNRNQQPNAERADIGTGGRTITLNGACTDGSPRGFRVSTYTAFGQGYRLVQFAPGPAFNQWADVYQKIAAAFSPSATGNPGQRALIPTNGPSTLLVHVYNGNLFAGAVDDLPGEPITRDADLYSELVGGARRYTGVRIAPDGKRLVFTDPYRKGLYLGVLGKPTTLSVLAVGMGVTGYPPAWSPDGAQVAYVSDETLFTVRTVSLDGSTNRTIARLEGLIACATKIGLSPSASSLATDRGLDLLFEWADPNTILLARGCNGLGVVRLNVQTGAIDALPQPISRPHLSPDKKNLIGLILGRLTVYEWATNSVRTYDVSADWATADATGTAILYTTRAQRGLLKLETASGPIPPFTSASYELTLHRLDLTSRVDTLLYQGEGYAVGTITPDAKGVAFSVIPSEAVLIEGLARGAQGVEITRLLPQPQLYWLANGNDTPILLANTAQAIFGPPGSVAQVGVPVAGRPR